MKVHRRYQTAIERQLSEAIMITNAGGLGCENIMNAKDEYTRCMIPTVEVSGGAGW